MHPIFKPFWTPFEHGQNTLSKCGFPMQCCMILTYESSLCTLPPPLSFPTPGKMVARHPLGDGHQVTAPHHPLGDRSTTVHAHCGAQKLRQKTK